MHAHIRAAGTLAAVTMLATWVAGCSGDPAGTADQSPSASAQTSDGSGAQLEIKVTGDTVTPEAQEVDLAVGETLTVKVTSDRAGVLHVHSSPEQEFDFGPGTHSYHVSFDKPGRVDIEEHVSDTLVARAVVQ